MVRFLKLVYFISFYLIFYSAGARDIITSDSAFGAILNIKNEASRFDALLSYRKKVENNNPKLSLQIATEMLDIATAQKSDSNLLKSYEGLGRSHIILNDYVMGLKYYTLMLQKAVQLNDYASQIEANIDISYIYNSPEEIRKDHGELGKAIYYIEKALAISREHGVSSKESSILNELAVQYDIREMHEKAIAIYKESLAAAKREENVNEELRVMINLGIALKNNKQYSESLEYYNNAAYLTDSLKLDVEATYLSVNLATLYFEMEKYDLCEKAALKGIALAYKMFVDPARMDAYNTLTKLYAKEEKYDLAFTYSTKLANLKDSVFDIEKSQQLKDLQAKYETDIKDKTIETQTGQIAFSKKQRLFLLAGLALLFGIAAIIFISQRRTALLNTKIVAQQHELILQKKQLEAVNGIKDRLFSVISHDMKAPVNSLIAFTQLLHNGNIAPEKLALYANQLNLTLNHTSTLMENLLNWAASQMQGFQPILENLNIKDLSESVLQVLTSQATAKNIIINNNILPTTNAMADANMLALVIRNLVANAIKYTPTHGHINLHTAMSADCIVLSVTDSGLGMDAQKMKLFNMDSIQQMESTLGTQNEKGTGLGLLLCKTFIKQMHGSITVKSNDGVGCRFDVALPLG